LRQLLFFHLFVIPKEKKMKKMEKRRKNYEKDDHVGNHVTQGGGRRAAERERELQRERAEGDRGWRERAEGGEIWNEDGRFLIIIPGCHGDDLGDGGGGVGWRQDFLFLD